MKRICIIDWFGKAHVVCDIVDGELKYTFTDKVTNMDVEVLHRLLTASQTYETGIIRFFNEIDYGFTYLEDPELIEDFILVQVFNDEESEDKAFENFVNDFQFCNDDCERCKNYNDCKLNEKEVI